MSDFDLTRMGCIAVFGATQDRSKFGYKVLKDLQQGGYRVYGINPNYDEIEGCPCFPGIGSLPQKPDLLIFVVPPEITEKAVVEAHEAGIRKIWMQPGSESKRAIAFCAEKGMDVVHDACIMIYRREGGRDLPV
ncbi:MAG: CoA-binding protein [Actinobacteria bacterium]|nr:CoA-binding protein [Actinomycetota bacterium]